MMPFNPFSIFTSKLFGGLLILSLVTLGPMLWITRGQRDAALETVERLRIWQVEMVDAVRRASNNPDVDASTAKAQVQEMGFIRIQLGNALDRQNKAFAEMQRQSEEALAAAREAERKRRAAIQRAEALQAELRNRSRVPAPAADMEAAVRQTQNELWEAGL